MAGYKAACSNAPTNSSPCAGAHSHDLIVPHRKGTAMSASPIGLLKTRRLWPLALAQSCGALNDNLVKNAMVVLALFQLGIGGTGLSALAGALFIAPYI